MMSFLQGEPAAILAHTRSFLFGSLIAILSSRWTDGTGIITAFFALGLGASGAVFSHWRTERGLWMLAVLFFLMNAVTYMFIVWGQLQDAFRGVRAESVVLFVDFAIGTLLLTITLRFLVRIAKETFLLSYSRPKE
jgi:hypothetical protein